MGRAVRIGSRQAELPFDWDDRSTWAPALAGVDTIYISYAPDLAVPAAVPAIRELVELAKEAGVRKLVLLSGRGEVEAQRCEQIVQDSGLDWTILRCSWFNQNFSENFMRDMVLDGVVALPAGDVREPFVDADDIADVAVAALTESGHAGQLYEITGPELLSFDEVVATVARAAGRSVAFHRISRAAFTQGLEAAQLPPELIKLLDYLLHTVLDGRNAWLGDGVQRALGREPRRFSDYATAAAAQGFWEVPAAVPADAAEVG
jgi:uncharacterized protein YbjT (DUF2867 family)